MNHGPLIVCYNRAPLRIRTSTAIGRGHCKSPLALQRLSFKMADSYGNLFLQLRSSTPAEQVAHLRAAAGEPGVDKVSLTNYLLQAVSRGALSSATIPIWINVAKDPGSTVAALRQSFSEVGRKTGCKYFAQHLQSDDTIEEAWAAVGGAEGLSRFIGTLSVKNVRRLCRSLAKNPKAIGA